VTLSIMGEGPDEVRLRARIAALGLGERIDISGWGSPPEVADFLRGLDALVLLTRTTKAVREQFGRVIIEAQACGIPVIGSTCGAIPDVVADGGWIVPERDPDSLRRLLDTLAADRAGLDIKARAARANVLTRFSYDAVATALASACRTADSDRKSRTVAGPAPFGASC
jgi:glycosyltransferase involved in cell wall biosynthesis